MISARGYARGIEARWAALLERPVVFGERDWALICDWHARGIPLTLIDDAFERFGEKIRRWRKSPRNLGAVAPLVEEAWRTVREGRSDPESEEPHGGECADPRELWKRRLDELEDPLRGWLKGLLEGPAAACEAELREGLLERLPDAIRSQVESEVLKELGPFRDRMSPEIWRSTLDAAMVSAARRRLRLPPLADAAPSAEADETF